MNLIEEARNYLRSCGIDDPEPDIKLMAARAAGRPLKSAFGSPIPTFDAAAEAQFRRFIARRGEKRVPVAYIVGTAEFMGLELEVTPSVLIPRPSTETLVECAGHPERFLEIGTGSGAVAIALALRGSTGVATDISSRALEIARRNAERHGVSGRITFVQADLFVPGKYDLILSNPPYVATAEFAALAPEVLHEPRWALDGGAEGMDVLRRIIAGPRAPRLLLECAPRQAAGVRELCLQSGFRDVRIVKDLDGFDRVVDAS